MTGKERWSKPFVMTEKQWVSIFSQPFTIPQTLNLNDYSTKSAMHYLLATNNSMYKIGKKETNLSPFCENVEETEYHLNWDCPKIQQLLAKFVRVCNPKAVKTDFDDKAIIFGVKSV